MTESIAIQINGEVRHAPVGASVADLLDILGLPTRKVAVERNRAIVSKSAYAETVLAAGDQLEIVHFVGGG